MKFRNIEKGYTCKTKITENNLCDLIADTTESIRLPMWCKNLGNNMPYIKKYGSISKLLCKTYPNCYKLDMLRNTIKSKEEHDINNVSKECQIPLEVIQNSSYMFISGNNHAGTTICNGCTNYIQTNKPILIIGNGPSIKKYNHLELLKKYGFNGDIFCVSSAIKKLLDLDIIPKYMHSLDANECETEFIDDKRVNDKNIIGIFSTTIHPRINQMFEGDRLFYNSYIENTSHIFHLVTDTPQTITCGNVGSASIVISSILGYNPIILIGMDLSFESVDELKRYYEKVIPGENINYTCNWEKDSYKEIISTINNKLYYVDKVFESYKLVTIRYMKLLSDNNVEIVNCTEQGALHDTSIKNMKFEEYLKTQRKN